MSTQIMDSSSGSMKLRALAMAMKTSSLTRAGTPCCRIHSVTVLSSCASTYGWPYTMAGSRPSANWIFSGHVSICGGRRGRGGSGGAPAAGHPARHTSPARPLEPRILFLSR